MAKDKTRKTLLTGDDAYLAVEYDKIELLAPPKPGKKTVLFNPRGMDGTEKYTRTLLKTLTRSIQIDGLQQPLIARVLTDKKQIRSIELLAGNGRYHCIGFLIKDNAPVFDDRAPKKDRYQKGEMVIYQGQLCKVTSNSKGYSLEGEFDNFTDVVVSDIYPTVPATKKYAKVPCKVAYDIDDWHAMRLSWDENDKRRDLETAEEVALVEYYLAEGFTQDQIVRLIDQNPTWVSQSATFRHKLPASAFKKLMDGDITRHVAVNLLSYPEADREKIFNAAVEAEKVERKEAMEAAEDLKIEAEDAMEIAKSVLQDAKKEGDDKLQKRAEKELGAAKKTELASKKKAEQVKADAGKIDQGHLQRGAVKVGAKTRKAKPLDRQQLLDLKDNIDKMLSSGKSIFEPECGEEVQPAALRLVAATINAICTGNHDPLEPIRAVFSQYGKGKWKTLAKKYAKDESPSKVKINTFVADDADEDEFDEDAAEQEFLKEYAR